MRNNDLENVLFHRIFRKEKKISFKKKWKPSNIGPVLEKITMSVQ